MAKDSGDATLVDTIRLLRNFILIGWGIYPIGYMAMPGGLLSGVLNPGNHDLFYNIGDAVNKIGFGLVVYNMAMTATQREATKLSTLAREIIIKQETPALKV
jgi:bacteriorhodopsin